MFRARDVMKTSFYSLRPEMTVSEAIKHFKQASEEQHRRVFGMIVSDEAGRLVGMFSMYDVLLLIRPKHTHVWGIMTDLEVSGLLEVIAERAQSVRVQDLMTCNVVTIEPDTHVMQILDIMIRKHVRRLPVVNEGVIEGVVYLSDLFYFLVNELSPRG